MQARPIDRSFVVDSWRRSRAAGVDPAGRAPESLTTGDLSPELLQLAKPVVRTLMLDATADAHIIVALFATDGTMMWVEGDAATRRRAEAMNFERGANWSETAVGTSAPGTALLLDREVQIRGTEHYVETARTWTCSAVPFHDVRTGAQLGAIDVTGDSTAASPLIIALLRATALAVEGRIGLHSSPAAVNPLSDPRIEVLTGRPCWKATDSQGNRLVAPLTRRHAEMLLLLSRHDTGLSAEEFAVLLDERDLDPVTVRAEMSRLRRIVGANIIRSSPYRLCRPVVSDIDTVLKALTLGEVAYALSHYSGPLLPRSQSPVISELRNELSRTIRDAVVASGDVNLLRRWLKLPDARNDAAAWRALRMRARSNWSAPGPP